MLKKSDLLRVKGKKIKCGGFTVTIPRKGSKVARELEAERKRIVAGKVKYKKLDL